MFYHFGFSGKLQRPVLPIVEPCSFWATWGTWETNKWRFLGIPCLLPKSYFPSLFGYSHQKKDHKPFLKVTTWKKISIQSKLLEYTHIGFKVSAPNHPNEQVTFVTATCLSRRSFWNKVCPSRRLPFGGCSMHHQTCFAIASAKSMQTRPTIMLRWPVTPCPCPMGFAAVLSVDPLDLEWERFSGDFLTKPPTKMLSSPLKQVDKMCGNCGEEN